MKPEQRLQALKILAACGAAFWILDFAVIEPAYRAWGDQSDRIEALQKKVARGQALLDREKTIRDRWANMQRDNLPADLSAAGSDAYRDVGRWTSTSGVSLASFDPQWQTHDSGDYDTYDCRASMTGDVVSLGRFIYELEVDPAPVNLEECEIASRDNHGQQLTMSARFSFIHLGPDAGSTASNPSASTSSGSGRGSSGSAGSGRSAP
jgi:hypothetical protein